MKAATIFTNLYYLSPLKYWLSHSEQPYFMAPEVFTEKYSSKADIWAVGCVVYQMFTGRQPWKELGLSNPISLYNYIKDRDGPPPLDSIRESAGYTNAFEKFLVKCFHRDPHRRPTANILQDDSFLFEPRTSLDDERTLTSKSLFSPGNCSSSLCDNIQSPISRHHPRRRGSLSGLRSPLLSPPIPKQVEQAPQWAISPLPPSPYDNREWPSWARGKLGSNKKMISSPSRSSVGLGQTHMLLSSNSLAVSDDTEPIIGIHRNLFSSHGEQQQTNGSDSFSQVSESLSLLRGELLLEKTQASKNN